MARSLANSSLSWLSWSVVPQILKYPWSQIFYYLIRKSFQSDEEWRLFYCDNTLGCRVIQDFDLCKLDDLWHRMDTKWCKITKNWISLRTFFVYNWNLAQLLHSSQSSMICSLCYFHDNTMGSTPSPFKGENQSFPPSRSFIWSSCCFIQWVWTNMAITQHKHKKVC